MQRILLWTAFLWGQKIQRGAWMCFLCSEKEKLASCKYSVSSSHWCCSPTLLCSRVLLSLSIIVWSALPPVPPDYVIWAAARRSPSLWVYAPDEAPCSNAGICATGLQSLHRLVSQFRWFIFALGLPWAFPRAARKTDFIYVVFSKSLSLLLMLSEGNGTRREK